MKNNRLNVNYKPGKLLRFIRKIKWLFFVYLRPRHDAIVHTANGTLAFDSKDKKTGRCLYVQRNFEYEFMHKTIGFLQSKGALNKNNHGIALDVGGYIGMSSAVFILDNLFDKSIAFEPHPDNYRLIQKNIALNKLEDKITVFNLALSDVSGELSFELSKDNFGDSRIRMFDSYKTNSLNESKRNTITVESKTLDQLIADKAIVNIDDIRLIWMDVQGHEGHFIKGAFNFLKTRPDVPIVMEFWPYAMNRTMMRKTEFMDLVGSLYDTCYLYNDSRFCRLNMSDLNNFYEECEASPDPMKGCELLLLNEGL